MNAAVTVLFSAKGTEDALQNSKISSLAREREGKGLEPYVSSWIPASDQRVDTQPQTNRRPRDHTTVSSSNPGSVSMQISIASRRRVYARACS